MSGWSFLHQRSICRVVVAAVLALLPSTTRTPGASADTPIPISGTSAGQIFDGIGALSGGGGNSRLLIDYPEPFRGQILDYLFRPSYGAALQILKVEIGGDTNSTDGAESSHEHVRGDRDCTRGYQWWLMEQAKARNPAIKLYGLAWGAPGWVGGGSFWSSDTVGYLLDWLGCAQQHGLHMDYLGGWNERGYNATFYQNLHGALRSRGYDAALVGADSGWQVADSMVSDPSFNASIDIIGSHYPCGWMSQMTACATTQNALSTGKPLWASESGSGDSNVGAASIARAINRGYIDAHMSAFINWPLVASTYPDLPFPTAGLLVANQPWSGAYEIGKSVWAIAHTTQFTAPGWRYVDQASGYFGGNRANGSYVTLRAPDNGAYSVVAETIDATATRTITFTVLGGLPTSTVHVWASNFRSDSLADYFWHVADLTPQGGSFSLTLQPGYIYSLSTSIGEAKGTASSPPPGGLGLPLTDAFEGYPAGREPRYLAQQQGAFETIACGGGRGGGCVRQMAAQTPIAWGAVVNPYAVIGSVSWTDYTVAVDVLFEQTSAVQVMGRVSSLPGAYASGYSAYFLQVADSGAWSLVRTASSGSAATLGRGSVPSLGVGRWHHLAVTFNGPTISAAIDGATVGSVSDSAYQSGQAGLGVDRYATNQFDNLSITPIGALAPPNSYAITNRRSGSALSVSDGSTADGAPIVQSAYAEARSQQWELVADSDGSGWLTLVNGGSGKLLEVPNASITPGTQLNQRTATGDANQQWQLRPIGDGSYQIYSRNSGLLVDASGASLVDGAPVVQATATGGDNQVWTLAAVPASGVVYALTNRNSGLALGVAGGSTADGGPIIQGPYYGDTNQQWRLVAAGGGFYKLVNVQSGKLVEEPNADVGSQLDQRADTGSAAQQWQLQTSEDRYYRLVNRATGLLADVGGASTLQGAAVIAWPATGGSNQQWTLTPVS